MKKKRITMQELCWKVESEGLDYLILHYFGPESVPAPLADAWKRAGEALAEIEAAIEAFDREQDEDEKDGS